MAEYLYAAIEPPKETAPAKLLIFLAQRLAPRAHRVALARSLSARHTSWLSYCFAAARKIPEATATEAVTAFDAGRMIGDLACMFIAFSAAPFTTCGLVLAAAALASLWRDGYIHPAKPTLDEAATDGFFIATIILLSQALLHVLASSWTVTPVALLIGLPISMIMIAGWRFVFRMRRRDRGPVMESYSPAWRLTVLWLAGAVALAAGNKDMLLTEGHLRDHLLGMTPLPFVMASLGALAGKIPVDNVNWFQAFVNTATFATLAVIWVEVKKINRQAGRELRREINKCGAASV